MNFKIFSTETVAMLAAGAGGASFIASLYGYTISTLFEKVEIFTALAANF